MKTILLPLLAAGALQAQSTMDATKAFSWSANAGFINWMPHQPAAGDGAAVHEWFLSGKIYAANFGWIDLGDGEPANGMFYQNDSASDCGVNVLPGGKLEGFAWSANTGWINFEQTHGKPLVSPVSGYFHGSAWSPNLGWINLGELQLRTMQMLCTDSDEDRIGDEYEREHLRSLTVAGPDTDSDGDGVLDREEYLADTDPADPQSRLDILSAKMEAQPFEHLVVAFNASARRVYDVQATYDLVNWWSLYGAPVAPPAVPQAELHMPGFTNVNRFFLRIRPVRPLSQ